MLVSAGLEYTCIDAASACFGGTCHGYTLQCGCVGGVARLGPGSRGGTAGRGEHQANGGGINLGCSVPGPDARFFHPAMAEVMGLTDEQRQATSLMLLWFIGMAMDIAQSTGDLEQAAPALAMLELFMEDLLASVLTPDQLKFWDQMFGTAPQGQTAPAFGRE